MEFYIYIFIQNCFALSIHFLLLQISRGWYSRFYQVCSTIILIRTIYQYSQEVFGSYFAYKKAKSSRHHHIKCFPLHSPPFLAFDHCGPFRGLWPHSIPQNWTITISFIFLFQLCPMVMITMIFTPMMTMKMWHPLPMKWLREMNKWSIGYLPLLV